MIAGRHGVVGRRECTNLDIPGKKNGEQIRVWNGSDLRKAGGDC